ncbi:MAG: VWA domain-containing protein [Chlorobi bacterium]|nr:MAG: VWA domain-containing protein [Bacteroidota bacterium]KXK33771.1 MAG: von Willebrand factor type A domain protein [Chlorobi bacterium OLB6]MBE2266511.1 VWA domain-containing protein [Flavobacteriales bacterium]MBL1160639.1 VWA domain-containing protein [Chlorobiota bacterium]MBW7852989.1 VWA domain-containing protein [Candidatus Kapabacteria bacterium]MCC6330753.1 VWA domain-containing protein [Ignavibacteria bacterium]
MKISLLLCTVAFVVTATQVSAGYADTRPDNNSQGLVPIHEMAVKNQIKYVVLSDIMADKSREVQLTLTDLEGVSLGGYAPPYLESQEEARQLWTDFINHELKIQATSSAITVKEIRRSENEAFAVSFVLDHSPSITIPRAVRMQRAIQSALKSFSPNDYVSVIKFTGTPKVEVELTRDRQEYLSQFKVNGLPYRGGGSAVYDAAMVSIDQLSKMPDDVKRFMVLFTDGDDTESQHSLDDVVASAVENHVVVNCVTYGIADFSKLHRLAETTNGRVYALNDINDFDKVFMGIYHSLRHSYLIMAQPNRAIVAEQFGGATMSGISTNGLVKTREMLSMLPSVGLEYSNSADVNQIVMTADINFQELTNAVDDNNIPLLDSIATVLVQRKDLALEIQYTSTSNNGEKDPHMRANAVRDVLIRRGVPPARVQSYGRKLSITRSNDDASGSQSRVNATKFILTKL